MNGYVLLHYLRRTLEGLLLWGESIPDYFKVMQGHLALYYLIVLVVGLRQLCNKLVLISLSSCRTPLVQLLHLVPNEMQSHRRISWLLLDGKVTVCLQSIITSHLKANPFSFLKECSHTCEDLYWPLINTAYVYHSLYVDRFIQHKCTFDF